VEALRLSLRRLLFGRRGTSELRRSSFRLPASLLSLSLSGSVRTRVLPLGLRLSLRGELILMLQFREKSAPRHVSLLMAS